MFAEFNRVCLNEYCSQRMGMALRHDSSKVLEHVDGRQRAAHLITSWSNIVPACCKSSYCGDGGGGGGGGSRLGSFDRIGGWLFLANFFVPPSV